MRQKERQKEIEIETERETDRPNQTIRIEMDVKTRNVTRRVISVKLVLKEKDNYYRGDVKDRDSDILLESLIKKLYLYSAINIIHMDKQYYHFIVGLRLNCVHFYVEL